jgi:methionyl-tRNA synthetase
MVDRYLGGVIPEPAHESELEDIDRELIQTQAVAFEEMSRAVDDIAPHEALKAAWAFVRKANAYVETVTPWALAKDESNKRRLEVVLYQLADALRLMSLMTFPIVPRAAQELWTRLGLPGNVVEKSYKSDGKWGLLPAGSKSVVGDPLFPRVEEPVEG